MTDAEKIQQQLNDEYDKFIRTKYNAKVKPPDDLVELFKKAILAMPAYAHKLNFNKVKVIANSRIEDLDNGMMNDIVKVVLNAPLEKIYGDDFYTAINKHLQVEKFIIDYNAHVDEFQKRLKMKKATLESLSIKPTNGMRIIN
jgi:hypothetical protein